MFKKLKLSAKIAALSVILFIFMSILGVTGVINMFSASGSSAYTAFEVLPAVKAASCIIENEADLRLTLRAFTHNSDVETARIGKTLTDSLETAVKTAGELAKTAKGLTHFPVTIKKLEPQIKEMKEVCDSLFDMGIEQNDIKEMFFTLGNQIEKDIAAVANRMRSQRDNSSHTSSTADRDDVLDYAFDFIRNRVKVNRFIQRTDTVGANAIIQLYRQNGKRMDEILKSSTLSDDFKAELRALREKVNVYYSSFDKYAAMQREYSEKYQRQLALTSQIKDGAQELMENLVNINSGKALHTARKMGVSSVIIVVLLILSIIAGVVMSVFIINSIVSPITEAIDELSSDSKRIAGVSGDISVAAHAMASGASERASSMKEISVSLDEIASVSKQTADNAKTCREAIKRLLEAVSGIKQTGGGGAKNVEEIAEAAKKIENIIDEISKASDKQTRGFSQVNIAIGNLDRETQFNASQSEELAVNSQKLSSQALSIGDLIGDLVNVVAGEMARIERERYSQVRRRGGITGNYRTICGRASAGNYRTADGAAVTGRYRAITNRISSVKPSDASRASKPEKSILFENDKNFGSY